MRNKEEMGFTLIELLIAMVIVAILVGIASPNFGSLMLDNRLASEYNAAARALLVARSEAVKVAGKVVICARGADNATCSDNWSMGWLVFHDAPPTNSGTPTSIASIGAEDTVLLQQSDRTAAINISAYGSLSGFPSENINWIRYQGDGSTNLDTASVLLCDSRAEEYARVLNIQITGDFRAGRKHSSSGIALDTYNEAVSC